MFMLRVNFVNSNSAEYFNLITRKINRKQALQGDAKNLTFDFCATKM